ncbi:unnamed protein product [Closterium sp. NIES-54]
MTRQLAGPTGGGTAAIVVGTALGGLVGFYVMHHAELRYKARAHRSPPLPYHSLTVTPSVGADSFRVFISHSYELASPPVPRTSPSSLSAFLPALTHPPQLYLLDSSFPVFPRLVLPLSRLLPLPPRPADLPVHAVRVGWVSER